MYFRLLFDRFEHSLFGLSVSLKFYVLHLHFVSYRNFSFEKCVCVFLVGIIEESDYFLYAFSSRLGYISEALFHFFFFNAICVPFFFLSFRELFC